jgi:hypothetical protein
LASYEIRTEFAQPVEAMKWTSETGLISYQVGNVYLPGELFELLFTQLPLPLAGSPTPAPPEFAEVVPAAQRTKRTSVARTRVPVSAPAIPAPPPVSLAAPPARDEKPGVESQVPETRRTVKVVLVDLLRDGAMTMVGLMADLQIHAGCTAGTAQSTIYAVQKDGLIEQFETREAFGGAKKMWRLVGS